MANEFRLDKKQIAEFQKRLEHWRTQVRVAAGQVTREGRELENESAVDVADRAINSATKEFLFRQAQERHRLLQMVEAGLERIRVGSFGECLACGASIGIKRLEAVPWTEYCVGCQEKRERGELSEIGTSPPYEKGRHEPFQLYPLAGHPLVPRSGS
jgi:DnaK suppressor protein